MIRDSIGPGLVQGQILKKLFGIPKSTTYWGLVDELNIYYPNNTSNPLQETIMLLQNLMNSDDQLVNCKGASQEWTWSMLSMEIYEKKARKLNSDWQSGQREYRSTAEYFQNFQNPTVSIRYVNTFGLEETSYWQ